MSGPSGSSTSERATSTRAKNRRAARRRLRFRFRWQGRAVLALTVTWVLVWGRFDLVTVVCGVVFGYLVCVVFPLPPIHLSGRLRPLGLLRLVGTLLVELSVASVRLAAAVLRPSTRLRPGVVRVDLTTRSDLVQVITAAVLSLVPGTLVVEAVREERRLYLHVFDLPDDEAAEHERRHARTAELRVLAALGSDAELARAREAERDRGGRA